MTFDPTKDPVTARVIFKGVMLMCINQHKWCEMGVITCAHHTPTITINVKVGINTHETRTLLWPNGYDLIFNVKDSQDVGVSPHSRATGRYAFTKILDLEGDDCHAQRLPVLTHCLDHRRLGFTAGKLYAHDLTPSEMQLLVWTSPYDHGTPDKELGRIALEVGLNINCQDVDGAGIDILNASTGGLIDSLPADYHHWYEIIVDNDCDETDSLTREALIKARESQVGTDFRYLYNVVISPTAEKYDLGVVRPPTKPGSPSPEPKPFPGVCETIFLGKTDSLGLA